MNLRLYILAPGHIPVPEQSIRAWERWFQNTENRRVALDRLTPRLEVSTIFLGIDHNWGDGPPMLFETLVFDNGQGEEMRRYATWDEAVGGHKEVVDRLRAALARVAELDRLAKDAASRTKVKK